MPISFDRNVLCESFGRNVLGRFGQVFFGTTYLHLGLAAGQSGGAGLGWPGLTSTLPALALENTNGVPRTRMANAERCRTERS